MMKHGMKSASKAKRARLLQAAEEEAEAADVLHSRMWSGANESKVDPTSLEGACLCACVNALVGMCVRVLLCLCVCLCVCVFLQAFDKLS
jgi:uncharacterized ion transporter superfamily protein YfcC